MKRVLFSWIGTHDLDAASKGGVGPVLAALEAARAAGRPYSRACLLQNFPKAKAAAYQRWLGEKLEGETELLFSNIKLTSPTHYADIYRAVSQVLEEHEVAQPEAQRVIHLSPGTSAMAAVWVLLAKTRFPAVCIESWVDANGAQHVREVELPFDIDARFTQEVVRRADGQLAALHETVSADSGFGKVTGGQGIQDALDKARRIALRDVPVLLLGESGTGKEVFAQAIHDGGLRAHGPFVPVNCGALPKDLAESLLFGHKKGAFTGATADHEGFFQQANGGTLFLDEIGELPLELQAKLLRALQEKQFTPVGARAQVSSDFRLIAATHRDLMRQVAEGQFREDLFYRIAVGVIRIPPLRERGNDIDLLTDALMSDINDELADQPGYVRKKISASARKAIAQMPWRGNVRELRATLLRAAVWSDAAELSEADLEEASVSLPGRSRDLLPDEIAQPIDINDVIADVVRHYIPLALKATGGNKTRAAQMLGLRSRQVLSDWIKKYQVQS